jgi:dienelactone hydrolase
MVVTIDQNNVREIPFTEKCTGSDSLAVFCWRFRNCVPPSAVSGQFMRPPILLFALILIVAPGVTAATAQSGPGAQGSGAQGSEGEPHRLQQWRVPSSDQTTLARAVLFRPAGEGPFPLAVIAHATTQNVLRRAQMAQPEYRALAAWLVVRGFAVLVPERPGHGGGGKYPEDQGGCDEADYARSGRATADEITAALALMRQQSFIRREGAVVIGHSAGAWGALALAGGDPRDIAAIIAFAPGRGGHANDVPNKICAPHTLIAAAGEFGKAARVKVTWLVAANDSYFSPAFSRQLADAFRAGGGNVDFRVLPALGGEGHWLAESAGGVALAAAELDRALKKPIAAPGKKR